MKAHRTRPARPAEPRRGIAAVELAALLPLIVFMTMASIDFSRVVYALVTLQNCARNGALYVFNTAAGFGTQYTSLSQAVSADAGNLVLNQPVATSPGLPVSNYVTVTVSCSFNLILLSPNGNLPGIPGSITLTQSATMPYPALQSLSVGGTAGAGGGD
jgi:Flp pilus assembly protein TadG